MSESTVTQRKKKEGDDKPAPTPASTSTATPEPESASASSSAKPVFVSQFVEGTKSEGNKDIDRHKLLRITRMIAFLVALPVAYTLYDRIAEQKGAMIDWPKSAKCTVHRTAIFNVASQKKLLFQKTENFRVQVVYSYLTPDGLNRTSNSVYLYEHDQPGRNKAYATQVKDFFDKRGCIAFVSPADPTRSILVREANFKPYLHSLVSLGVFLAFLWYMVLEHDWNTNAHGGKYEKFSGSVKDFVGRCEQHQTDPDYEKDQKEAEVMKSLGITLPQKDDKETLQAYDLSQTEQWYVMHRPCGIRGFAEMFFGTACVSLWHFTGFYLWTDFTALHHVQGSADELRYIYHLVGGLLVLRLIYQISLVIRVQDVCLLIDTPQITVGEPFVLVFKQCRRSRVLPLSYKKVIFDFVLTETTHGPRKGQTPNRSVKKLHNDLQTILHDHHVPRENEGILEVLPFRSHVFKMMSSEGNLRRYYRWSMEFKVHLSWTPLSYNLNIPLDVHVPDVFKEVVETPTEDERNVNKQD